MQSTSYSTSATTTPFSVIRSTPLPSVSISRTPGALNAWRYSSWKHGRLQSCRYQALSFCAVSRWVTMASIRARISSIFSKSESSNAANTVCGVSSPRGITNIRAADQTARYWIGSQTSAQRSSARARRRSSACRISRAPARRFTSPENALVRGRSSKRPYRSRLVFVDRNARVATALAGKLHRQFSGRLGDGRLGSRRLDRSVTTDPLQDEANAAWGTDAADGVGGIRRFRFRKDGGNSRADRRHRDASRNSAETQGLVSAALQAPVLPR